MTTERQAQMAARILLHNRSSGPVPNVDHVEYCGRGQGSVLGNPYTSRPTRVPGTHQVATRDEAVERHRNWMCEQLRAQTVVYRRVRDLAAMVTAGQTICLICFCVSALSWTLAIDRGSGMPLSLSDLSMTLLPNWFTGL